MINAHELDVFYESTRKNCKELPVDQHIEHMFAGIISELGEVLDHMKKWLVTGIERPADKLREEWADTMWYLIQTRFNPDAYFDSQMVIEKIKSPRIYSKDNNPVTIIKESMVFLKAYINCSESVAGFILMTDGNNAATFADLKLYHVVYLWVLIGLMMDLDLSLALQENIAKLAERYKDGFTSQEALVRKDKGEVCYKSKIVISDFPAGTIFNGSFIVKGYDFNDTSKFEIVECPVQ